MRFLPAVWVWIVGEQRKQWGKQSKQPPQTSSHSFGTWCGLGLWGRGRGADPKKNHLWLGKGHNWDNSNRWAESLKTIGKNTWYSGNKSKKTKQTNNNNKTVGLLLTGYSSGWLFPGHFFLHFWSWSLDLLFFFWSALSVFLGWAVKPSSLDLTRVFRLFGICHF